MNREIRTSPRLVERVLAYVLSRQPSQWHITAEDDGTIRVRWQEGRLKRIGEYFTRHGIVIDGPEVGAP